jgi:hypothetical protein
MPIIARRKPSASKKASHVKASPSQGSGVEGNRALRPDAEGSPRPTISLMSILALILGVMIPLGGYYYWRHLPNTSNASDLTSVIGTAAVTAESREATMAIQRFAKLASITTLSKKEFEVNFISLEEAKRAGNPQIIAALEIVIHKKRQELAESKEKMIESLLELNLLRQAQPSIIDGLVQTEVSDARERGENETARELELLASILGSVPTSAPAKVYFSNAIENRL